MLYFIDISSYQKEAPEITVGVLSPDTMMDVWKARFPNEDVSNFTADEFYTYLANHEGSLQYFVAGDNCNLYFSNQNPSGKTFKSCRIG